MELNEQEAGALLHKARASKTAPTWLRGHRLQGAGGSTDPEGAPGAARGAAGRGRLRRAPADAAARGGGGAAAGALRGAAGGAGGRAKGERPRADGPGAREAAEGGMQRGGAAGAAAGGPFEGAAGALGDAKAACGGLWGQVEQDEVREAGGLG